jgi:NADH-ubiquinone oxidoreductase chain 1
MTEHSAGIFVFFFLAEYASIVLICIFTSILFLGGYLFELDNIIYIINDLYNFLDTYFHVITDLFYIPFLVTSSNEVTTLNIPFYFKGLFHSLTLGIKTSVMIFIFI